MPPTHETDRHAELRAEAERWLQTARQNGDRRQETRALVELGALTLREGATTAAIAQLEAAVLAAEALSDFPLLADARDNLGLAVLAAGDTRRAIALFDTTLQQARQLTDAFTAKIALEHLGRAFAQKRNAPQALALYQQALDLARQVHDQRQQADLLWDMAVQYAELTLVDHAARLGLEAVALMRQTNRVEADWFAAHLQRYRQGEAALPLEAPMIASWTPAPTSAARGPGVLRMALTATTALAQFLATGLRPADAGIRQQRRETCAACPHHTGIRCRLCGCFTAAKAALQHERCPIGRWPS